MVYLRLFWSFFQIGLFSIGGGYAAMPLIQTQAVEINHWLTMSEFADIITIAEMTPGPIAVNSATFVGIRAGGIPGALVATLGCITPSCIIVLTLAYLYGKYQNLLAVEGILSGLRPAVVAMIASAGLSILCLALWGGVPGLADLGKIDWISLSIFLLAFFCLRKWKPSPIAVMFGAGVLGVLAELLTGKLHF